jgi:hypothetical protein
MTPFKPVALALCALACLSTCSAAQNTQVVHSPFRGYVPDEVVRALIGLGDNWAVSAEKLKDRPQSEVLSYTHVIPHVATSLEQECHTYLNPAYVPSKLKESWIGLPHCGLEDAIGFSEEVGGKRILWSDRIWTFRPPG